MKKIIILLIIILFSTSCNKYNRSVFRQNCQTEKSEVKFLEKQRTKQWQKREY